MMSDFTLCTTLLPVIGRYHHNLSILTCVFRLCIWYQPSTTPGSHNERCVNYVNDGQEHRILLTVTGTTATFRVDGAMIGSVTLLGPVLDGPGTLLVGKRTGSGVHFRGQMKAARVFFSALTTEPTI